MTKNKRTPRKTGKIVRMPATKYAHLQKRLRRAPAQGKLKTGKGRDRVRG